MENELNTTDIIGYCWECKELITSKDDYVKDKGKLFCTYCYKVLNNVVDELDFDE